MRNRFGYGGVTGYGSVTAEEEQEVAALVALFRGMGFSRSSQVSHYIRAHRLGYQFPHISGYLRLACDDEGGYRDSWEFEGGIAPKFYAIVCSRLGLGNNGSHAYVTGFDSYAERDGHRRPSFRAADRDDAMEA